MTDLDVYMSAMGGINARHARELIESGRVYAKMTGGKPWRIRVNGATKTWKRRMFAFRIPVKAGFRAHGYVTESNLADFLVEDGR